MLLRWLVLATPLGVCTAQAAPAQFEPTLDGLHGPHDVGFEQHWALDRGRSYVTAFDQGATYARGPRPIPILVWFPAEPSAEAPAALSHAAYLGVESQKASLGPLSQALVQHARAIVVQEITGQTEEELSEQRRARLEGFLRQPTRAAHGLAPITLPEGGAFPILVHHSGAGSSFEDNARLCETLASHGYVVLTSAFLSAAGQSLGIDGGHGSAADIEFLVSWAQRRFNASAEKGGRVGLIGHSLGAQAILKHAARPGCPADAIVLLDTTQDYYALGAPLFASYVEAVSAGIEHVRAALLVAAGPSASFQLVDRLQHANRIYVTFPYLDHNHYIEQGLQRLSWMTSLASDHPDEVDPRETRSTTEIRGDHRALVRTVLGFLDAELRDRRAAFTQEIDRLGNATRVPPGQTAPPDYQPGAEAPPTPRQVPHLIASIGADAAGRELARFFHHEPQPAWLENSMLLGSTLLVLVQEGRIEDARALHREVEKVLPRVLGLFTFTARMAELIGRPDDARQILEAALTLEPGHTEAREQLNDLEPQD